MRNFILSAALAVSAIVSSGAAEAADLPVRTYTKAPIVVEPVYNWTGALEDRRQHCRRAVCVHFAADGRNPWRLASWL